MKNNEEIAREGAALYIKEHQPDIHAMKDNPEWHPSMYDNRHDGLTAIILQCLTQAQESREGDDKHFDSYTKAILSLAMFDLAFHRLKSQALRLSVTRRSLPSEYQDAVLASELDKLIEIANEPEPTWPESAARPIPSPGAEGDTSWVEKAAENAVAALSVGGWFLNATKEASEYRVALAIRAHLPRTPEVQS
jgi:hypothetical protein